MTKDIKSIAHRKEQIAKFMGSEGTVRYTEHRPQKDLLLKSLEKGAHKALDRIDAENADRKVRGEAPLPEEYSELSIVGGVVSSEYDKRQQRENALAEQKAYVEAGNDVFER